MNKVVAGSIVLLVIIISIGFYLNSKKVSDSEKMMVGKTPQPEMTNETPDSMAKETPDAMMKNESGKYIEYTDQATLEVDSSKRILYFYANWCPTCIPTDKEFNENVDKLPSGVTIIRVNYNDTDTDENEKALARMYGITYQHTFVQIDENGNEISEWNGGGLDKLLLNIK